MLWHIMLECDRSGVLEIGDGDEVDAVMVLTDLPEDVVSAGLKRLASQNVTVRHGASLVVTKFLEANSAVKSERARAKEYRERNRDKVTKSDQVITKSDDGVTKSDEPVTPRHEESRPSQNVTPSLAYPSLAELSLEITSPSLGNGTNSKKQSAAVAEVFAAWQAVTGHNRAKLDPKRERLIRARLKDFSKEDLIEAIQNIKNSPFHLGENDQGAVYDHIELILRDNSHVEKFLALKTMQKTPTKRTEQDAESLREALLAL